MEMRPILNERNDQILQVKIGDEWKDIINLSELIKGEVRKQMSQYNLESLARIVIFALSYSKQDHKNTIDAEKTLEHFLKLVG